MDFKTKFEFLHKQYETEASDNDVAFRRIAFLFSVLIVQSTAWFHLLEVRWIANIDRGPVSLYLLFAAGVLIAIVVAGVLLIHAAKPHDWECFWDSRSDLASLEDENGQRDVIKRLNLAVLANRDRNTQRFDRVAACLRCLIIAAALLVLQGVFHTIIESAERPPAPPVVSP